MSFTLLSIFTAHRFDIFMQTLPGTCVWSTIRSTKMRSLLTGHMSTSAGGTRQSGEQYREDKWRARSGRAPGRLCMREGQSVCFWQEIS